MYIVIHWNGNRICINKDNEMNYKVQLSPWTYTSAHRPDKISEFLVILFYLILNVFRCCKCRCQNQNTITLPKVQLIYFKALFPKPWITWMDSLDEIINALKWENHMIFSSLFSLALTSFKSKVLKSMFCHCASMIWRCIKWVNRDSNKMWI